MVSWGWPQAQLAQYFEKFKFIFLSVSAEDQLLRFANSGEHQLLRFASSGVARMLRWENLNGLN